jgi:hypothetical protein
MLLVQIYMDDIIFGGSSHALVAKFLDTISREFEMSMMGELTFFLGLQIKQLTRGRSCTKANTPRTCSRNSIWVRPSLFQCPCRPRWPWTKTRKEKLWTRRNTEA